MIDLSNIRSPKQSSERKLGRSGWFPYYAGFSWDFAQDIINRGLPHSEACVLDPWNGSGTTTAAAAAHGRCSYGNDLNPVMGLAALARLLNKRTGASLIPLAKAITSLDSKATVLSDDPLLAWFHPASVVRLRSLQLSLHSVLLESKAMSRSQVVVSQDCMSDLAASLYLAILRIMRILVKPLKSKNPTWTRIPRPEYRIKVTSRQLSHLFVEQVELMALDLKDDVSDKDASVSLNVGSSELLPYKNESVDLVLSSPPYCTRIDYASATRIELALLGYGSPEDYDSIRRNMIGTTTVPALSPVISENWGDTCLRFLDAVEHHSSKASSSYYYKNHCQYFSSISNSMSEIERCLKPSGLCVLVVQDSFYKSTHNDLPRIFSEMAMNLGLETGAKRDFQSKRNMARMNPKSVASKTGAGAIESVIAFRKPALQL